MTQAWRVTRRADLRALLEGSLREFGLTKRADRFIRTMGEGVSGTVALSVTGLDKGRWEANPTVGVSHDAVESVACRLLDWRRTSYWPSIASSLIHQLPAVDFRPFVFGELVTEPELERFSLTVRDYGFAFMDRYRSLDDLADGLAHARWGLPEQEAIRRMIALVLAGRRDEVPEARAAAQRAWLQRGLTDPAWATIASRFDAWSTESSG